MTDYERLRSKHLAEYTALLPAFIDEAYAPSGVIAARRLARLRDYLRVAKERSAWHAKRLEEIDPDSATEQSLCAIPPMTKLDLMANFDAILTDSRLSRTLIEDYLERLTDDNYLLDEFHVVASGGSSGVRGVFVYDWAGWRTAAMIMRRFRTRAAAALGVAPGVQQAVVGGAKATHMTFAFARLLERGTNIAVPATLPLAEIVARLNAIQPIVLLGYPSMLAALAQEAAAGALKIAPRLVFGSGEPLFSEMREAMTAAWKAAVINHYASSEGAIATDCGAGEGLHLNEDVCIFEPVDEEGNPVPTGVRSAKVYVTPLYNLAQPLIRYELTDEIIVLQRMCSCGSPLRLIDDIGGRADDVFRYGDAIVHPMVFRSRLGQHRSIIEYQVRQTNRGADIAVRAEGEVALDDLRGALERELTERGVTDAAVTLHRVERLDRQATGKLRRFVPLSPERGGPSM